MVEVLGIFVSFTASLFSMQVPGLGVTYGALAIGLFVLSVLLWALRQFTGGE